MGRLRGDVPEEEPARSRSSLARRRGIGSRAQERPGQGVFKAETWPDKDGTRLRHRANKVGTRGVKG